ncbi:O-antigen ligase family protein [Paenibacillus sp. 32O-W]|uniref:O-antigen ligase family protein n=1 Tax=Paenibacillus sp. 32O-W TaxID=1695218 RepID=UPI00136558EB|nr:O-antigen ligase family protein [Paenibacillus sp. 32O-W]
MSVVIRAAAAFWIAAVLAVAMFRSGLYFDTAFYRIGMMLSAAGALAACGMAWRLARLKGRLSGERRKAALSHYAAAAGPLGVSALYALSLLRGPASWQATIEQGLRWSAYAGFLLVVLMFLEDGRFRLWLAASLQLAGALLAAGGLAGWFGWMQHPGMVMLSGDERLSATGARLGGFFQYPNMYGAAAGAFVLWQLALLVRERGIAASAWSACTAPFCFAAMLLTESRGAWLAFAAGWLAGLLLHRSEERLRWLACSGSLAAAGAIGYRLALAAGPGHAATGYGEAASGGGIAGLWRSAPPGAEAALAVAALAIGGAALFGLNRKLAAVAAEGGGGAAAPGGRARIVAGGCGDSAGAAAPGGRAMSVSGERSDSAGAAAPNGRAMSVTGERGESAGAAASVGRARSVSGGCGEGLGAAAPVGRARSVSGERSDSAGAAAPNGRAMSVTGERGESAGAAASVGRARSVSGGCGEGLGAAAPVGRARSVSGGCGEGLGAAGTPGESAAIAVPASRRLAAIAWPIFTIGFCIAFWTVWSAVEVRVEGEGRSGTAVARLVYYMDGWTLLKEAPLFGQGGGTWRALYASVQREPYVSGEVHNGYLNVALDLGAVGLAVFLAMLGAFLLRIGRRDAAMLAVPVVLLTHAVIDFDMTYGYYWILLFCWLALHSSGGRRRGKDEQTQYPNDDGTKQYQSDVGTKQYQSDVGTNAVPER